MKQIHKGIVLLAHACGMAMLLLACTPTAQAQMQGLGSGGGGGAGGFGGGGSSNGSSGPAVSGTNATTNIAPNLAAGTIGSAASTTPTSTIGGPATSGGANSVSSGVSTSNIFYSTYSNPQAFGIAGQTQGQGGGQSRGGSFGGPLFGNLTQSTPTTGTVTVSIFGTALGGSTTGGYGAGIGSGLNAGYGPTPVRTPEFSARRSPPGRLQTELRRILSRSTSLVNGKSIEVLVDGEAVLLRGKVTDDRERRLAEGLVWLSPGVSEVRNELRVP
jgi:osmotically-inducible protein OsmY